MKLYKIILSFLMIGMLFSCGSDFLENEPAGVVSADQLAKNPASAQSSLDGIYAALRTYNIGDNGGHIDYGHMAMKNATDMMGNDVTMSVFHWFVFYNNYDGREQTASRTRILWKTYYSQIFAANSIINTIDPATEDPTAQAILGQALALRGMFYHVLVRIYCTSYLVDSSAPGIPLYDGTSFDGQPRGTVADVYTQITSDLETAVTLLEGYARPTITSVDQQVAQGFLARAYLDIGDWTGAASMANAARSGYTPVSADDYLAGFSDINTPGWMWGSDIDAESSTIFASFFSHFDNTNNGYAGVLSVYKNIDVRLYDMIPDTDIRKQVFIDPVNGHPEYSLPGYANIKFRDPSFFEGDYLYMRAAEMYLIEAEALARMGDGSATTVLMDLVTTRDPEFSTSASGDDLVEEIYLQRRIELWCEGTSWFDLKRLNKPLERDYEGTNHASFAQFNFPAGDKNFNFQIPEDEINANDAISEADQNP